MVDFTQPAWLAALGTAGSYAVLLLVMTVLLFGVPYLVFVLL
jgi:hypothetical protein